MQDSANVVGGVLRRIDWANIALAYMLLYIPLSYCISDIWGNSSSYIMAIRIIYLVLFVMALPIIYRSCSSKSVAFLAVFGAFYLGSIIICVDTELVELANYAIFYWCLPYFFLGVCVSNHKDLLEKLKVATMPMVAIQIVRTFLLSRMDTEEFYNQELGYDNLLPLIIYWMSFLEKRKPRYLVIPLVSFILILMSGSRGPVMCALLGLAMSVFISRSLSMKQIFILLVIMVGVSVVYFYYQYEILSSTLNYFSDINVSTRTVSKLLDSSLSHDDSRNIQRTLAREFVLAHPISGSGFLNDRLYMFGLFRSNALVTPFGSYCHNFFLEIMMQFGAIPGLLLIVLFLFTLVVKIVKSVTIEEQYIWIAVLVIGFFPLLVSRSYLTFPQFYLLVGMMFVSKKGKIA